MTTYDVCDEYEDNIVKETTNIIIMEIETLQKQELNNFMQILYNRNIYNILIENRIAIDSTIIICKIHMYILLELNMRFNNECVILHSLLSDFNIQYPKLFCIERVRLTKTFTNIIKNNYSDIYKQNNITNITSITSIHVGIICDVILSYNKTLIYLYNKMKEFIELVNIRYDINEID